MANADTRPRVVLSQPKATHTIVSPLTGPLHLKGVVRQSPKARNQGTRLQLELCLREERAIRIELVQLDRFFHDYYESDFTRGSWG